MLPARQQLVDGVELRAVAHVLVHVQDVGQYTAVEKRKQKYNALVFLQKKVIFVSNKKAKSSIPATLHQLSKPQKLYNATFHLLQKCWV